MNCPLTSFATLATAKPYLARQLRQSFAAEATLRHPGSTRRVFRLEIPLADGAPLPWLEWQTQPVQVYWADRQQTFEAAGIGVAHVVRCTVAADYRPMLRGLQQHLGVAAGRARYYGGLRFNPATPAEAHWQPYGSGYFVLPQFELCADASGSYFACNVLSGQSLPVLLQQLEQIVMSGPATLDDNMAGRYQSRWDIPNRAGWCRTVEVALHQLADGGLEKLVLGRSTRLEFAEAPAPLWLLQRLKSLEPCAYHFCIQPEPGYAFVGATPERLYRRQHDLLHSEAVAGTCQRGANAEQDRRLGETLLRSDKERREQAIVREAIQAALGRYCRQLDVSDELQILKQARIQHLYSAIKGRLLEHVSDGDLLQALHPTPAVGGLPRAGALAEIARLEQFDRGWFAGPVGWLGHDAAEFAVGIRSALVTGPVLRLFAGAGLVAGSVPAQEWDEIESKIGVLLDALGQPAAG